ncbi:hypothetical protein SGLAD_v1c06770 [Spiroplasma gladiatoris]|uniref:Uncharacterized protein n=1 Tax=Spiroplasma gladiatoris TaxID=2143 RepID=A0A4P7AJN2_9MOLU|nr:hypothetical protein [Spiroplasma gladiatoris]QBQ07876.1 hypothetical protein SGLAD_v1c06770 [Spiroplasma gladiatoris]
MGTPSKESIADLLNKNAKFKVVTNENSKDVNAIIIKSFKLVDDQLMAYFELPDIPENAENYLSKNEEAIYLRYDFIQSDKKVFLKNLDNLFYGKSFLDNMFWDKAKESFKKSFYEIIDSQSDKELTDFLKNELYIDKYFSLSYKSSEPTKGYYQDYGMNYDFYRIYDIGQETGRNLFAIPESIEFELNLSKLSTNNLMIFWQRDSSKLNKQKDLSMLNGNLITPENNKKDVNLSDYEKLSDGSSKFVNDIVNSFYKKFFLYFDDEHINSFNLKNLSVSLLFRKSTTDDSKEFMEFNLNDTNKSEQWLNNSTYISIKAAYKENKLKNYFSIKISAYNNNYYNNSVNLSELYIKNFE